MLEIGRVTKAHGLHGEVAVQLVTNVLARLEAGSVLVCGDETLVVTSSRPHGDRWLVRFEGCDDRDAGERLAGRRLFAEEAEPEPGDMWVHDLIGRRLVDQDGTDRGEVVSVVSNPASDLLELEGGTLVPLTFVTELGEGVVLVDVPDGLFEL